MASLLPAEILGADKKPMKTSDLEGKVIALYFSAHWCPPCRATTPMLCQWYANFKATSSHASEFEVVFVSSDHSQEEFDGYFGEMNFCALPFDQRDAKNELSKRFKVQGIPTLVIVDADGSTITTEGRAIIHEDPQGAGFPWRPAPLSELLADLVDKTGAAIAGAEALKDKVVGLYFSAHWCGPCRATTPQLVALYNKLKEAGKPFEIVFVTSDRDEPGFKGYFAEMPWLALPFGHDSINKLKSRFAIRGIPSLVILDEKLDVITTSGRAIVGADPEGANYPWKPKPAAMLTEAVVDSINENSCVIYFTEDEADLVGAMDTFTVLGDAQLEKVGGDMSKLPLYFFVADDAEELPSGIRQFAGLGSKSPALVILDVPSGKKYVAKDPSLDGVASFIEEFQSGSLPGASLR